MLLLSLVSALAFCFQSDDVKPAAPPAEAPVPAVFEDMKLTVTPPVLDEMRVQTSAKDPLRGRWIGKWHGASIDISLMNLPEFEVDEPDQIVQIVLDNLRQGDNLGPGFLWDEQVNLTGSFGITPYSALAYGSLRKATEVTGTLFMFAGLLETGGYVLQIETEPAASDAVVKMITEFLQNGVKFNGTVRDYKWTDAEVEARWDKIAPEKVRKKFEGMIRTKHYVILSNSDGAESFAKKAEEYYERIRKTYPFDEVAGRKLMPIYLFKTPDEYYEFLIKNVGWTRAEAEKTKGIASGDFYTTYYEAPNDPVHIHEMTHQIFRNRLFLGGGGSWFQEGVAEYIESKPNELNQAAADVKKNRHTPLREFFGMRSLVFSSKDDVSGDSAAGKVYKLAALLIEYLRDSKQMSKGFPEFMHLIGNTRPNDVKAIEAVIRRVYKIDLDTLEKQWIEYCKKR